ncbi:disease resistance protein At4g27190-like [Impatiens glandulifera]|uniref:disease resistance protein At4g27190-like n=1 Tax=Impatiens glandulifera TaxID=253017 RepID=UPI001FB115A7|nr:disease resistance protein At4g27190-like [Impatiens glandulifera]
MELAIICSLIGKIALWLFQPIQRELGYLIFFKNNIKELETRLNQLQTLRNTIQGREDAAKRKWQTLGETTEEWIETANGKIKEAENIIRDKAEFQKGCFSIKCCPDIRFRYYLGKEGKKSTLALIELIESADKLPTTNHDLPPFPVNMLNFIGDVFEFKTRTKATTDLIELLMDKESMLIGICGMGGIGKTTFVHQVIHKVKNDQHLFDIEAISKVSRNPKLETIQNEIAEALGFSLKDVENEMVRAVRLRNALVNKNVVVLLDDVWKEFDLNAKGFPLGLSVDDHEEGYYCKIVYTSRIQGLWASIRTKREISLELLSDEEAHHLFRRKAYALDDIDSHSLREMANQIVKECGRLPLALEVVGSALFQKSKHEWEDMLFRLRNHSQENNSLTVPGSVYSVLETSYDFLEEDNARSLFLLCCLFQEDEEIPIETLYRYAVGLHLFKGMNNLRQIRLRVYTIVFNLIRKNLLVKVRKRISKFNGGELVVMHDVVRDVGISIASRKEHGFLLVCDGDRLVNELKNDGHTKVSIVFEDCLKFPERMDFRCSTLELLRLNHSFYLSNVEIPESFFKGIEKLKVLDIVRDMPQIAYSLQYLGTFKFSSTINVSSIGHLRCLEVLSLRESAIETLPKEISELTNLKLLDLTSCCHLRSISHGILSRLTNLQELYMWHSFNDWRLTGGNARIIELDSLHKLWRLELEVPNIEQIPRGVKLFSSSTLLRQYKISIGVHIPIEFKNGEERQLWVENVDNISLLFHELGVLTENSITNLFLSGSIMVNLWEKLNVNQFLSLNDLVLEHCGAIESLFYRGMMKSDMTLFPQLMSLEIFDLPVRHLKHLEELILERCKIMKETIICNEMEHNKIEFSALIYLKLWDLESLKSFCNGVDEIHFHKLKRLELRGLHRFVFPTKVKIPCLEMLSIKYIPNLETLCNFEAPNLKDLEIYNCDKLRYVFSMNFMKSISHLQYLTIVQCKMLKGVLSTDAKLDAASNHSDGSSTDKPIEFLKLMRLHLESLDELVSFFVGNMEKPQRTLFHDQVSFPCLEDLRITNLPKINYIMGYEGRQNTDNYREIRRIFPKDEIFGPYGEYKMSGFRRDM